MKNYYTYDAFISYRHADLDKFVAENLHKKLEAFKLPHSASKNRLEGEKTRIKRIFRDKDELPIASDLASPILTALSESEFLIVICSPRTPESIWVKREIENFISLHDRDHILAVLIEGEPEESFPPALLTTRKEITLEDGTKTFEKVAVEPLAADVRGKNRRQVLKNIKKELLRLAAPMFDCSYDDLKQRHRQRRIKRILTTVVIANLFLIAFGSFSTIQAMRISRQAKQIQEQSNEIQKQSDKINDQYQEIRISSLNTLADASLRLLDEGDRMKSILVAKEALPTSSTDTDKPLVPHAEHALADALYVYENESQLLPDRALDHDTDVQFMVASPSGKRLLTVDSTNIATIWNTASGEPVSSFIVAGDSLYLADEDSFTFASEDELIYYADSCLQRYNFMTQKTVWKTDKLYVYSFAFSSDLMFVAVTDYDEIRIYNTKDGSVKASIHNPEQSEGQQIGQQMTISNDSELLAYTSRDTGAEGSGEVSVFHIGSNSITNTIETSLPYICSLCFTDQNHLAIAANSHVDLSKDLFMVDNSGDVILYDLQENTQNWKVHFPGDTINKLYLSDCADPFLIALSYDTVNPITLASGEPMGSMSFSSGIVDCVSYKDNTYGYCLTRDGMAQSLNYDGGIIYDAYFEASSNNIKSSVRADNYVSILPYSSRQVVLYRYVSNKQMEELASVENDAFFVDISQDSTRCFVTSSMEGNQLIGFDYVTKKKLFAENMDSVITEAFYVGEHDENILLILTNELQLYDSQTGKLVKTIPMADYGFMNFYNYQPATNQLFLFQRQGLCVYDLNQQTFDTVYETDDKMALDMCSAAATYDGKTYLISNRSTGMLEEYQAGSNEPIRTLELNTNYITNLFYSDDGSQLFVVYKNRDVEVYQAKDFTLLHTYTDLNGSSTRYIATHNKEGDYILANNYQGYLCTAKHEVKAYLPHLKCLDVKNQKLISHNYHKLNTIPIYDLDMLLTEADRQLGGRKLTDKEKTEYYIQ